ncbi:MAG: hypothetical protein EP330_21715 [Deltaproteobacteria bacterium]|nr:MAG: hypothetical protein EP330_21715 [Deltaproteobacteria bacterium]
MTILPLLVLAAMLGCAPGIPDTAVAQLGEQLCAIGHPKATCQAGRVVGESHGPLSFGKSKERWIDVGVAYELDAEPHEMTIRVHVKKLSPCRVRTSVVADDGPAAVLLDNPVTSKLAGDAICKRLGG